MTNPPPVAYRLARCHRGPNDGQIWVIWESQRIWILPALTVEEPGARHKISWEKASRYVWWPTHPQELRYKRPATHGEVAQAKAIWTGWEGGGE